MFVKKNQPYSVTPRFFLLKHVMHIHIHITQLISLLKDVSDIHKDHPRCSTNIICINIL